jgi:hypothetical protein
MANNSNQQVEDIFGDNEPRQKKAQSRRKPGLAAVAPAKKSVAPIVGPTDEPATAPTGPSKRSFWLLGGAVIFLALVVGVIVVARSDLFSQGESSNQNNSQIGNSANSSAINSNSSTAVNVPTVKPAAKDSDGDGLSDEEEQGLGTDLYKQDTDTDGLFDREEIKIYKSDPLKKDTDADGFQDGQEVDSGNNPTGTGKLLDLQSEIDKLK